jgi:hypothetical protein
MAEQTPQLVDIPKAVEEQKKAYETELGAKAKLESDVARRQEELLTPIYESERQAQEQYGEKVKGIDKQLNEPYQIPKESLQDYATLANLAIIMGIGLGGAGKQSAMATLAGMNGLIKGYQTGRKDMIDAGRKEFETNLRRLQAQSEQAKNELQMYLNKSKTNKEEALTHLNTFKALTAGGMYNQLNAGGMYDKAQQTWNTLTTQNNAILDRRERLKHQQEQTQISRDRLQFEMDKFEYEKRKVSAKIGDFGQFLKDNTGAILNPKDTESARNAVVAVGQAYSLLGKVKEHPEWVGRSGQVQQFFNRYVDSLKNDKPLPPDDPNLTKDKSGQEALVFAKEYAAYLVNYERALSGGGVKGFTVYFQKRFNDLLQSNQFNAQGFTNLMNQQIDEISKQTSALSPGKITKNSLSNMAMQLYSEDPYAVKGFSGDTGKKPSSLTKNQLNAYATKHNMSEQQARDWLTSQGYVIGD